MINLSADFIPALMQAIKAVGTDNIPKHIFSSFIPFMNSFDPSLQDENSVDLKILYEFSKKVGCSLNWLTKLNDITYLVVEPSTLTEQ